MLNAPKLFVCEDAQQAIWMFENYPGCGGGEPANLNSVILTIMTVLVTVGGVCVPVNAAPVLSPPFRLFPRPQ